MGEYIIDEGPQQSFRYNGTVYIGYIRYYSNGDCDVEVYNPDDIAEQVDGDVYEYAFNLFENQGLI